MSEKQLSETPSQAQAFTATDSRTQPALRVLQTGAGAGLCTGDHCVLPSGGHVDAG